MIDHGKLIVYDTISNVTAKFSEGQNIVEVGLQHPIDDRSVTQDIATLPGVVAAEKRGDRNLKVTFNGGMDVQERILSDLVRLKIGVISYKPASSELEDAYLKLIKDTV